MTVAISNMSSTFANSSITYTGIGMNARFSGNVNTYSTLITLKANGSTEFVVDVLGNVGIGTSLPTTILDVNGNSIRIRTANTPSSDTAPGKAGEIRWDSSYLYICTSANTWRRVAHSSW